MNKWPNLTPARYLGTPCGKCGCSIRNKANRSCVSCQKATRDRLREKWREANPEAHAENCAGASHRTKERRAVPELAAIERDKNAERMREYRADPVKGPAHRARLKERRQAGRNPMAVGDRQAVAEIYRKAKALGLTVDHIVPLSHPLVCGLHVSWNMQLLTHSENSRKHNQFDETMGIARR